MNKLKILFPLLYIINEWDLWTKNVICKKEKTKKKARVNVKVSHLLQLNSKKWIKLVQKIPRGSDASLIHVRSTWRKHLPTLLWYLKTKTTTTENHSLLSLSSVVYYPSADCRSTLQVLWSHWKLNIRLRDGEVEKLGRKMDLGVR